MNDLGSMTKSPRIRTQRLSADDAGIRAASAILKAGGTVAMPTETVYGLAADATSPDAVARIYAAKNRPIFNPLIAHFATMEAALAEGIFSLQASAFAHEFWPGPLTLVVPAGSSGHVCELARAGLSSVALRLPGHGIARDLIAASGIPLAAPSANRSGHVSPTTPEHVLADLDGLIDAVIMAGPCPVGVESTILACLPEGPVTCLRAGGTSRRALEKFIGQDIVISGISEGNPIAPGQLSSHYATRSPLRLNAVSVQPGELFLGFGPLPPSMTEAAGNLSPVADLTQAAARLYGELRRLDQLSPQCIAVAPIPDDGLGEAINDRLRRAAVTT
jgi:L-threonylcarbamoyladenylate synthase